MARCKGRPFDPFIVARCKCRPFDPFTVAWLLVPLAIVSGFHGPSPSLAILGSAQMQSPIQGQGMDPLTAGVTNVSTPVYFSVGLKKLINVDGMQILFVQRF